jgi:hypothetical protein
MTAPEVATTTSQAALAQQIDKVAMMNRHKDGRLIFDEEYGFHFHCVQLSEVESCPPESSLGFRQYPFGSYHRLLGHP